MALGREAGELPPTRRSAYHSAMPRVLHVIDAETSLDMLRQLDALVGRGDTIASIGPPPPPQRFALPVVEVHRPMGLAVLTARRMEDLARGAEIVHSWSPLAHDVSAIVAKLFVSAHVMSYPAMPIAKAGSAVLREFREPQRQITVPTEFARGQLIAEGFAADRVHVLPPCAPASHLPGPPADGTDRNVRVAVLGEMVRGAGHRRAAWAHAIVRQVTDGVELVYPGGGPCEPRVRFFAETTGYGAEIHFVGDSSPLSAVLGGADLAVFLPERDTGVGDLVTALGAGVPVVASRRGEIVECTGGEEAAVLCEPGSPREAAAGMLRLAEDADLRAHLGARGRAIAGERFAPEAVRERLGELYVAAVRQSGR